MQFLIEKIIEISLQKAPERRPKSLQNCSKTLQKTIPKIEAILGAELQAQGACIQSPPRRQPPSNSPLAYAKASDALQSSGTDTR